MNFPPLISGRLLRRYKRFLADIELDSGEQITAHCANPGSMKTMKQEGSEVWLSKSDNPKRKLAYSWELVRSDQELAIVNTLWGNRIVEEALREGVLRYLSERTEVRREVAYGEKSRVDFLLEPRVESEDERPLYIEVKSVTMADGLGAAFPDSPTKRGQKHLRELIEVVNRGDRAMLLFCCGRNNAQWVRPADEIDADYGRLLREAKQAGVELLAYGCRISLQEVSLHAPLPIRL